MQYKAGFNVYADSDSKIKLAYGSSQVKTYVLADEASYMKTGFILISLILI